jgi:hypothetical protein
MTISPSDPATRLNDAFSGRRCVSAWLGHGEVLFLGFGDSVLPARDSEGERSIPPFELETHFADWSLEGPNTTVPSDSNRRGLEAAAESLIGERVVSWNLLENNQLSLTFAGEKVLSVIPWRAADGLSEAWSVGSADDGFILAVSTDGRVVVVNSSLPVRDWFHA